MARTPGPPPRRSRAFLALLLLACATVITLDAREDSSSPVDPLRAAVGAVMGPVENGVAAAFGPVIAIPDYFGDVSDLREHNADLQATVDRLRGKLHASQANAHRDHELAGIGEFASTNDLHVVPAQVVALGPAQSFSQTVTIDAGRDDGVVPDLTVINDDGLVGRVLRSSADTATVLLVTDSRSTVGARLNSSMELGLLRGNGDLSDNGRLTMTMVDHTVVPKRGDTVLTWGSRGDAPYLPGIPIGEVVEVQQSAAELGETARVKPYVDFSSLDVVAVVTGDKSGERHLAEGGSR